MAADLLVLPAGTNGIGDCPSNHICGWNQLNYNGDGWGKRMPNNTLYCYSATAYPGGPPSVSMYNNASSDMIVYLANYCSVFATQLKLAPGQGFAGSPGNYAYFWKRT